MATGTFERVLAGIKGLTGKQKDDLVKAEGEDLAVQKRDFLAKSRKRVEQMRNQLNKPIPQNVTVALGGAAAEFVRRKLVGRVTDNVWGQAVGVAAVGATAQLVDDYLGTGAIKNIGLGHMGAAGFIAAAKGFDKEGSPDPVCVAYQGTTEKYIKDQRKKKKDDDDK